MSRFVPKGVMPALVTPFTRDGDISEKGFEEVINYTISKGATGVVPAGTTGEFSYMRTEERKKLLKLTVEYVDGRVPIIAGTGQNSTKATVLLTKYAADIGCDAALVISPYYLRPGDKGYYEHYSTVARKADLPIIMYNIPQCTLGVLNSNVVEDLAEVDNIVGIKDSSGNVPYLLELVQKVQNKIEVIIGADECFMSAVAAGVNAAILASANLIPHIWLDIMNKVRKGKIEEAAKLQRNAQTLARIVLKHGAAPPIKAGLKMIGINAGKCRMPLDTGGTLTPEIKEEVRLELERLGILGKFSHPHIQSKINVLDALSDQGFTINDPESIKHSSASGNKISVSIATGSKRGELGEIFVKLLTMSKIGHEALSIILEPNLAVRPSSIMFPLQKITSMRQASLFYGPVQSGAARALVTYLEKGLIPPHSIQDDVVVMVMDVDLNSTERREITMSTQEAVEKALAEIWR